MNFYHLSLIVSLVFILLLCLPRVGAKAEETVVDPKSSIYAASDAKDGARSLRILASPKIYNVGAILMSGDNIAQFLQIIEDVNFEPNVLPAGVTLQAEILPMSFNIIREMQNLCEKLFAAQVHAIILNDVQSEEYISRMAGFYNIPVIGTTNRDATLSDKHLYPTYLRTIASDTHQLEAWMEILKSLDYSEVVVIHNNAFDGRRVITKFEQLTKQNGIEITASIEFDVGFPDIFRDLEDVKLELPCRVFILYANTIDAEDIFQQVALLNMSASGHVWIVSEQAAKASNRPNGILSVRLQNRDNAAYIRDAVYVLGLGIKEMHNTENITRPPSNCKNLGTNKWDSGPKLFNYFKKQTLLGKTGRVAFDDRGDRVDADYDIINTINGHEYVVGNYSFSHSELKMHLAMRDEEIIWPGNAREKPTGYFVSNHLRVATIVEIPFVMAYESDNNICRKDQVYCPIHNSTTGRVQHYCCEGYCMDLLQTLANNLNFTYEVHQVEDGLYGDFVFVNNATMKTWTGLIGELVYDSADIVVASLTINPERGLAIDFTKPFKYQGITILEKKQSRSSQKTLASFLEPFENELWLLVGLSVHVIALSLYLLDRFSPFGRYKLPNSDITEEDALNLSSAVWFAWGVLLNSGIGEGMPRSFSGRVLGVVWAGFAMILVASYTANLAAFLVLDRPEASLSGINDPRLRNPLDDFKISTINGSAVDMYFKRQIELSNMYKKMVKDYRNVEDAISDIKAGVLNAFIWESVRLEYEAAKDCELTVCGELFGRSGYAIGLQKGSLWSERFAVALLSFHESGYMEDLDNKWIFLDEELCDIRPDQFPATLGLKNMAGVFILVGVGILGGVGLIIFEIGYKKHQTIKVRKNDLARNTLEKWREYVEKRKLERQTYRQQMSREKYKKRQEFYHHHKQQRHSFNPSQSVDPQMLSRPSNIQANGVESTPFTVEKGLNEIVKLDTEAPAKPILNQRRPRLTREMSLNEDYMPGTSQLRPSHPSTSSTTTTTYYYDYPV